MYSHMILQTNRLAHILKWPCHNKQIYLNDSLLSFWRENMLGYSSADIICFELWTAFRKRSSKKTVSFYQQTTSQHLYMSIFSYQWRLLWFSSFECFCNAWAKKVFTKAYRLLRGMFIFQCILVRFYEQKTYSFFEKTTKRSPILNKVSNKDYYGITEVCLKFGEYQLRYVK